MAKVSVLLPKNVLKQDIDYLKFKLTAMGHLVDYPMEGYMNITLRDGITLEEAVHLGLYLEGQFINFNKHSQNV